MYENKMNLINNLAKDLIYFFKSENNVTLSKLKKYLSNNNNLNVNIDSLINLLESNGIIYYYNDKYKLFKEYSNEKELELKLKENPNLINAELISNFNMNINNETIPKKDLFSYLLNYTGFNKTINDILLFLKQNKIIFEKDNILYISLNDNQEKELIKELRSSNIKDYTKLIDFIKNTKMVNINNFVLKIIKLTDIQTKIHDIIKELIKEDIIYEAENEYINLFNNQIIELPLNTLITRNFLTELIKNVKEYYTNQKESDKSELTKIINKITPPNSISADNLISILEDEGILFELDGIYKLMPTDYRIGKIQSSAKGNPYLVLDDGTNLMLNKETINGALPNDEVIYYLNTNKKLKEGKVIKIIERTSSPVLCEVKEKDGKKILVPHNVKGVLNLRVNKNELKNLLNGDYILVKPDKEKINDGFNCHLVSDRIILTDTNLSPALALIAIEHECNPDYCKEVYEEIKNIPDEVSNSDIESRKNHDFRDKTIFTIDGISTKDMDDAVGIEILPNGNYQITVSIAEPNHYVKKGTAIYNEAIQRDFTLYMLNTAIHMFHPKLANGICSLNEKVDRLTKTAIIEIDQEGNIVNSKVCKSVINSKKKMTYDDVNSILENEVTPEGYEPFVKDITPMKEITDKIWDKKEKEGLLELNTVKHEVNIDSNNNVTLVEEERGPAQKMIEILMILANTEIGTLLKNSPMPGIYRVHEESDKQKIYALCSLLEDLGIHIDRKEIEKDPRIVKKIIKEAQKFNNSQVDLICNLILQTFKRAKYTTTEGMHWALDLPIYTHFTSPIRRIADFIVHECLDDLFELYDTDELIIRDNYKPVKYETNIPKKEYALKKMEIDEIAREATRKERLYDQAENEAAKLILLESLKEQIGTSYNATIQMVLGDHLVIKTEEGIEGIIYFNNINGDTFDLISKTKKRFLRGRYTGETYKIGNEVNITMINIDEFSGDIEFNLNYKRKNLASRGKVLTQKPNKK